jgi:hypothetical protein
VGLDNLVGDWGEVVEADQESCVVFAEGEGPKNVSELVEIA